MLAFSDPGDIVADLFLGSGTLIAGAHVLGRVGYGIEISPVYTDVAVRRIANLTGEEPILAETGQTMAEVAAARGVPLEQAAEVEEPVAVCLEVETFARGIGSDKDADGMLVGVGVEGPLDILAFVVGRGATVDRDAVESKVGIGDCGPKLLVEIAQRVFVFGEDDDARAVPAAARALNVKKHGGFERRPTNPAPLETVAPLETLCALVLDQCS